MKNSKNYIILLLAVCFKVSVLAQNQQQQQRQHNYSAVTQANPQLTSQVDTFSPDYKIAQFKKSIEQSDSVLKNNPKISDKLRVQELELQVALRDSIIFYQNKIVAERANYDNLKNRLEKLEVYEFLNRRDVSVFTDDLTNFNIPLSLCNQTHYSLIEKIHKVNNDLLKLREKISYANIKNLATQTGISEEEAKQTLYKSAEKDLLNIDTKMDEVDKMDLSVLSYEQQEFYNKTMLNIYRAIYRQLFPK